MSRRRKTLCHAEIENFLSELQTDGSPEQSTGPVDVTAGKLQLAKMNDHVNPLESTVSPEAEADSVSDPHTEMRASVRSFVRHSFAAKKQIDSSDSAVSLAKTVRETCSYNLLPMRVLQPEAFVFPVETIESKRAVLMSLGPMLDEAEKQRKIDVAQCEGITRCRIESKRTRASWYQYSDVDSTTVIDPSEYEDRYLKFLSHMKEARYRQVPEGPPTSHLSPKKTSSGSNDRKALKPISNNVMDVKGHDTAKKVTTAAAVVKIASAETADNDENVVLADDLGSPVVKKEKISKRRGGESSRRSSISSSRHGVSARPAASEASPEKVVSKSKPQPPKPSPTKRNTYAQIHRSPSGSPGGPVAQEKSKLCADKRRATLSPGKMKAMLDLALADDTESDDDVNFSDCNAGPIKADCAVSAVAVPAENACLVEEVEVHKESGVTAAAELGDFLSSCDTAAEKNEDPIDVVVCAPMADTLCEELPREESNPFMTEDDSSSEYKVMATIRVTDSRQESPVSPPVPVDEVNPSPDDKAAEEFVSEIQPLPATPNKSSVISAHIAVESDLEKGRDCPRDRARCRLFLRLEISRWKHAWEMASIDAVEVAAKRNMI